MVIALIIVMLLALPAWAQEQRSSLTVEEIAVQLMRNNINDQATSTALMSLLQEENKKLKETLATLQQQMKSK
jgi:DNA-binding transcriptional MerR regulator